RRVEAGRRMAGEGREQAALLLGVLGGDGGREALGLLAVAHDDRGRVLRAVGEGGLRLLVLGLAVDDDRVALLAVAARGLPDLFDKHAGGVVLADRQAVLDELEL